MEDLCDHFSVYQSSKMARQVSVAEDIERVSMTGFELVITAVRRIGRFAITMKRTCTERPVA